MTLLDEAFEPDPISEPEKGHNLSLVGDIKPRQMSKSIMAVYRQLGGDAWLLEQAKANPKEFLGMIKHILPKNIDLSADHNVQIVIAGPQNVLSKNENIIEQAPASDLVRIQ